MNRKQQNKGRKGRKRGPANVTTGKFESLSVARLRTNSAEFAQTVRGFFNDVNTTGVASQAYAVFLQYPSYYRNAAGTVTQCSVVTGLLAQEQKVFDEYKVVSLKVKYLPFLTGQVRVADVAAPAIAGAPASPLLIMGVDADDGALWTSVSKAVGAQNPAIMSKYQQGIPTQTMVQTDKVEKLKWLNLGFIIPSASASADPNNPAKLSSCKLWVDGYQIANQVEGLVICEWTVLFKGSFTLA